MSSGRHGSRRGLVDEVVSLDVNRLKRRGLFGRGTSTVVTWHDTWGRTAGSIMVQSDGQHLTLRFRQCWAGQDWRKIEQPVAIEWTPCHLGGSRPWFVCPLCSRRAGKLYALQGGFICRRCAQLDYRCQRETPCADAIEQLDRLKLRLGGLHGMDMPFPHRPRGMHSTTYRRHVAKAKSLVQRMLHTWPGYVASIMADVIEAHDDLDELVSPGPIKRAPARHAVRRPYRRRQHKTP